MRPLCFIKAFALAAFAIALLSVAVAAAVPQVTFNPSSLTVTAGEDAATPPIVIQNAAGITSATLYVTVPDDVTVDTAPSGSGLACVTQGSSVAGLFFAEWNSSTRTISITCYVSSADTLEIVSSIAFTAPSTVTTEEFGLSGTVTGGSGTPTFTPLTILPVHTVSFTSEPAVSDSTIDSGGSTTCSATAVDSRGHSVSYVWSDGGKGGSFSPSAASQNPTYTAPSNTTGSNMSITLTCTASCPQDTSVNDSGHVVITVSTKLAGDVDKDGDVDKTDADLVLQYLFGDIAKTAEMDANSDGSVTIADAQWILAHQQSGS
ncbi:dockerin type I domain-containing protein [bacterium]|nr:dockerin type I domain-containing protein [bacterium]